MERFFKFINLVLIVGILFLASCGGGNPLVMPDNGDVDVSSGDIDSGLSGYGTAKPSQDELDYKYYEWYYNKRTKIYNKDNAFNYGLAYNYFPSKTFYEIKKSGKVAVENVNKITVSDDKQYTATTDDLLHDMPKWVPEIDIPEDDEDQNVGNHMGSSTYPAQLTWAATRLDSAADTSRERVLVVFERLVDVAQKKYQIWGRFYDSNGEQIDQDVLISAPPSERHNIDPRFHEISVFSNLTEPTCDSYRNPTVVFLKGNDKSEDRYVVAYEAHCRALVNFPKKEQFFNNPQPENPIFQLGVEHTNTREQKFSVIQGIKLDADDLSKLDQNQVPGPFVTHKTISRLFAWFLNNDLDNGAPVFKDNSIWKWSSSYSPHLSVDNNNVVLLTYNTNLKFTSCLSNRVDLGEDAQNERYDALYSTDGRLIYQNSFGSVFSFFRDIRTAEDRQESNPDPDMCVNFERADNETPLVSTYNPVSASNLNRKFAAIMSFEYGSVDDFSAHKDDLRKTISGNTLKLKPDNQFEELGTRDNTKVFVNYIVGSSDIGGSPTLEGEYPHIDPDIVYDAFNKLFITAYDDEDGVHVFPVGDDGLAVDPNNENQMIKGINWDDPIAERGYHPKLTTGPRVKVGDNFVSKFGLSYNYLSSANAWLIEQNYVRVFENNEGIIDVGFEKSVDNAFNLSFLLERQDHIDIDHSFGPVSEYLEWGEVSTRFRTFWTGSPAINGETIMSIYVPEGMNPVALFDVLQNGSTWQSEDETGTKRLNEISHENPIRITLNGSRSTDPDLRPGAPANGIVIWSWIVRGAGNNFDAEGQTVNVNLEEFGEYNITLKIADADGLSSIGTFVLKVEENKAPVVSEFNLSTINGDAEVPLDGEEPVVIVGQEIVLQAIGQDTDQVGGTLPENLTFEWVITSPTGTNIRNITELEGSRKVKFTTEETGRYSIEVTTLDVENARSESVTRHIIAQSMSIVDFASESGEVIDLSPASVQGNPRPTDVYGEVTLSWQTLQAESVKLFKQEWVSDAHVGDNPIVEVPSSDIPLLPVGNELPLNNDEGIVVRLTKKTSFVLEITSGGVSVRSEPVIVSFNAPSITLSVPRLIAFNNASRNGTANLQWQTRNIKEVHIVAYEWENYQTAPDTDVDEPRNIPGLLALIQNNDYQDNILHKTTYVLRGTDLYGNVVEEDAVTAFEDPSIVAFTTDTPRIDFVNGENFGVANIIWQTSNTLEVVSLEGIQPNGERIEFNYRNPEDIEEDNFPNPDAEGRGSTRTHQNYVTRYILTVKNPDGKLEESEELEIVFNQSNVDLSELQPTDEGDGELYLGRESYASWSNPVNVREMYLEIIDSNGRVVESIPRRVLTLDEIYNQDSRWVLTIPAIDNPVPQGYLYQVRATINNPNTGQSKTISSNNFTAYRRPSPKISSFTLEPETISELSRDPRDNSLQGETTLRWSTEDAVPNPIHTIRRRVSGHNWEVLELNYEILGRNGAVAVPVVVSEEGQIDQVEYSMTVKNRFDDLVSTGEDPMYEDEQAPPANARVSFSAPEIISWNLVEENASIGGIIHLNWQTNMATRLDVKYIRNARERTVYSVNIDNWEGVTTGENIEVLLPDDIEIGAANIRIDLLGPGGEIQSSLQPITIRSGTGINYFISNVRDGERINLDPATLQGNPRPQDVHGTVYLKWDIAGDPSFVRILKREWLSSEEEGQGQLLLVADNLDQAYTENPGYEVPVNKNTTFVLEATIAGAGGQEIITSEVRIIFNEAEVHMNSQLATINYNNDSRSGSSNMTWTTQNIKSLNLVAYEWADFQSVPNLEGNPTRSLSPVGSYLQLNEAQGFVDNMVEKTTYVLVGTDLYNDEHVVSEVIEFNAPSISLFQANPQIVNYVAGQDYAETVLNWNTRNSESVRIFAEGVEIAGSPVVTDAQGNGEITLHLSQRTNYTVEAAGPDGKTVISNIVTVSFLNPSINIEMPVATNSPDEVLYHGRAARVSWNNPQNVSGMSIYLVDVNGDIVPEYPETRIVGIENINNPPREWNFNLPEIENPSADGMIYRIRVDIDDPNGGAPISETTAPFNVSRRPAPAINDFSMTTEMIEDLYALGGQIYGRAILQWVTADVSAERPIVSLRQNSNHAGWLEIAGIVFDSLQSSDSIEVQVSIQDDLNEFELTVRNIFDDRIATGGTGLYLDNPMPPVNVSAEFALPTIVDWSVEETNAYSGRNIHLSWDTKTTTFLEVVFIRNGDEQIIHSEDDLESIISSERVVVQMPEFDDGGDAELRLDLIGPAGEFSSETIAINLRDVPKDGVLSFCAEPSYPADSACNVSQTMVFAPGRFDNPTVLQWSVEEAIVERVVRICAGAAPDVSGNCPDTAIELQPDARSLEININEEMNYWLVTKPFDQVENEYSRTPVVINFNEPVIDNFISAGAIVNQNSQIVINWSQVAFANEIEIAAVAGDSVEYFDGNDWTDLPVIIRNDNNLIPDGSLIIISRGVEPVRLVLTATGPGGTTVSDELLINVNDIPSVSSNIINPNVDYQLFAPTYVWIEWTASEIDLDDDMGVLVDANGISTYAICYDIYRTDENGDILDPDGNKENDLLEGEGVHCPDITSEAYSSLDDLPENIVFVEPLNLVDCVESEQCRIVNERKYYNSKIAMDPKLNDPTNPERSFYLRYEIRVLTIDSGENGLLGIQISDQARLILTDDSVQGWWRFERDFTNPRLSDCSDAPAGYNICDLSRYAHHAKAEGNSFWLNPGIVLNPNNEGTDWIRVHAPLSEYNELTAEFYLTPYTTDESILMSIGANIDEAFDEESNVLLTMEYSLGLQMAGNGGAIENIGVSEIDLNESNHVLFTARARNENRLYLNGTYEEGRDSLLNMRLSEDRRHLAIGKSGNELTEFSGEIHEVMIYNRELTESEIKNRRQNNDLVVLKEKKTAVNERDSSSANSLVKIPNGYCVAWEDWRHGNLEIYVGCYDNDGDKLSEHRITDAPNHSVQPSLVYNGDSLAVSWRDNRFDNYEIYFALLDIEGNKIGNDVRITDFVGDASSPSLVVNDTGYAIAWTDNRDGNNEIYFALLDENGDKIGNDIRITNAIDNSMEQSLVWTGNGYGLVWQHDRDGSNRIYYTYLDTSGNKLIEDVAIEGNNGYFPSLVWNGIDFGLAWQYWPAGDPSWGVYFMRIDEDGNALIDPVRINPTNRGSGYSPKLVWNENQYGLVWRDSRNNHPNREMYFTRLDVNGNRIGSEIRVTGNLSGPVGRLSITSSDNYGYILCWDDFYEKELNQNGDCDIFCSQVYIK